MRCARRQAVLAGALVAGLLAVAVDPPRHCSQAGLAAGSVTAHRDDYARDRHPAGLAYERALARRARTAGDGALLTSCGMSAVVVALAHLARAGAPAGAVLIGASTYHETRDLLRRAAPRRGGARRAPGRGIRSGDRAPAAVLRRARCRGDRVRCGRARTSRRSRVRLAAAQAGAWLVVDITGAPLASLPSERPRAHAGDREPDQARAARARPRHRRRDLRAAPRCSPRWTRCASTSARTSPTPPSTPSPLPSAPCSPGAWPGTPATPRRSHTRSRRAARPARDRAPGASRRTLLTAVGRRRG